LEKTPPQIRLRPKEAAKLREELASNADAAAESRKMLRYPTGRFALEYAPGYLSTKLALQQNGRAAAQLLVMDAYDALEEMQPERALQSIQAILNVGHCFDDEPLMISQLIRMAMQSMAVRCLERTLAQGPVADSELARLQPALAEEAASDAFLVAMRGERAGMYEYFNFLVSSNMTVPSAIRAASGSRANDWSLWDPILDLPMRTVVYRSNAWLVQFQTKIVNAARIPGSARYQALRELDLEFREFAKTHDYDRSMAKLMAAAVMKIAEAERRIDTQFSCAVAALAAERFRLKHERWPIDLNELAVAQFLPAVPEDLYTGQPLLLRRAADGIVIYSVGKDGNYQGDALDRQEEADPDQPRVEFRLWDAERRRQPPLPPRKEVDDEP
jgi:hypothetical protein